MAKEEKEYILSYPQINLLDRIKDKVLLIDNDLYVLDTLKYEPTNDSSYKVITIKLKAYSHDERFTGWFDIKNNLYYTPDKLQEGRTKFLKFLDAAKGLGISVTKNDGDDPIKKIKERYYNLSSDERLLEDGLKEACKIIDNIVSIKDIE